MFQKISADFLPKALLNRGNYTYKGDYGHALLVCGCDSMPGAASLAVGAALKSGCGLVTLHSSAYACSVSASVNPSAILSIDPAPCFSSAGFDLGRYRAIGIGPGLGRDARTASAFKELLFRACEADVPMVLDADALNLLSADPALWERIPAGSVMTPHDGELARLVSWNDPQDKIEKTRLLAQKTGCVIVSKGYHSLVFVPGLDQPMENTTGNPGMAKGGSGDVLLGLITGLIARGYASDVAAMMGVWIHGYAGDCCTSEYGFEAYNSRDLIDYIYKGFRALEA